MCRVVVASGTDEVELEAGIGESLLTVLQRMQGTLFDAPCGGNGTCGKCRVRAWGALSPVDATEARLLGESLLEKGLRLACRALAAGDCRVELTEGRGATSAPEGVDRIGGSETADPLIRLLPVSLPPPSLEDQRSLVDRAAAETGIPARAFPLSVRRRLAEGREPGPLRLIASPLGVIDAVRAEDSPTVGLAIDLGTSTVVLHAVDLTTGELIATSSALNAQKAFGADVISRIGYASSGPDARKTLQQRVVDQIQGMAEELARSKGIVPSAIVAIVVAGNTTMLHLLAGVDPAGIAVAPFIPVFTDGLLVSARELGLRLHPNAEVRFVPSIAAYVGADIVAGIVATGMDRSRELSLLIDLGTNCEVALGNRDRMVACATAAGPAFEGAQIECGMGGTAGAIRRVWIADGLRFETIAGAEAVGLCGSGILDTVALLLESRLVDVTGRMVGVTAAEGVPLGDRIAEGEDGPRFELMPGVYFSQKDLREIQLAKAAIASGVEILASRLGRRIDEIERVFLAGAFGSSLSRESACRIGLLPRVLEPRIEAVGNSSGQGVLLALRSTGALERAQVLCGRVEYVELSGDPQFNAAYIEHMIFPDAGE